MKFTISKHSQGYDVQYVGRPEFAWSCGFDEMLGLVSVLCLQPEFIPKTCPCSDPEVQEWLLEITQLGPSTYFCGNFMYSIEQDRDGIRHIVDNLAYPEMLGWIATFALTGRELYGGMKPIVPA